MEIKEIENEIWHEIDAHKTKNPIKIVQNSLNEKLMNMRTLVIG